MKRMIASSIFIALIGLSHLGFGQQAMHPHFIVSEFEKTVKVEVNLPQVMSGLLSTLLSTSDLSVDNSSNIQRYIIDRLTIKDVDGNRLIIEEITDLDLADDGIAFDIMLSKKGASVNSIENTFLFEMGTSHQNTHTFISPSGDSCQFLTAPHQSAYHLKVNGTKIPLVGWLMFFVFSLWLLFVMKMRQRKTSWSSAY